MRRIVRALVAAIAMLLPVVAEAAEIKLMCPAPMRTSVVELVAQFEKVCRGVVMASVVCALVQAILAGIGFAVLRVDNLWLLSGITMVTAIVSLVTGRPVSDDVAMTGEVTLTGQVLPIGGVREKVLAAQRAGVHTVVLPSENEPDLEDLPAETRKGLEFVLAEHVDEVLEAALDGAIPSHRPSRVGSPERKAALPAEF